MTIRMSRSDAPSLAHLCGGLVRTGLSRLWHTGCMVCCTGCFYVQPVWKPPENRAPQLESVQPVEGVLMFDSDNERITVIARDPDGDPLLFVWSTPAFSETSVSTTVVEDNVFVSRLDIARTPNLDGEQIVLTILDSTDAIDLAWRLEDL